MSMFILLGAFYLFIGAIAGFLAGLFGIGGGILLVPAFYYTLSFLFPDAEHVMQISVGTALASILVTGISSVRAHAVHGNVRKDIILKLAGGIIVGGGLSGYLADQLSSDGLKTFFALMIVLLAGLMIAGPTRIKGGNDFPHWIWTNLSGAIIGLISGLMGIGGATLSVPYMSYFKTRMQYAVGTASAIGLCIAVPGVVSFMLNGWHVHTAVPYTLGFIFWPGWLMVSLSTIIAANFGARAAHGLDPDKLRRIFAIFMAAVAGAMIAEEIFS